jgi:hypothetical protein
LKGSLGPSFGDLPPAGKMIYWFQSVFQGSDLMFFFGLVFYRYWCLLREMDFVISEGIEKK